LSLGKAKGRERERGQKGGHLAIHKHIEKWMLTKHVDARAHQALNFSTMSTICVFSILLMIMFFEVEDEKLNFEAKWMAIRLRREERQQKFRKAVLEVKPNVYQRLRTRIC
jgi:hypothetical protein